METTLVCESTNDTLEVSINHKHSVTPCTPCARVGCIQPAQLHGKYCSSGCRQKAYRRSPAHRRALDKLSAIRFKRRRAHQAMKSAYKAFTPQTGLYSGPSNSLVPRRLPRDLEPYKDVTTEEIQNATQRRESKEETQWQMNSFNDCLNYWLINT